MLRRSGRSCKPEVAGILCLTLACSTALAQDSCCDCSPTGRGTYIAVFGGGGSSSINGIAQMGTALFPPSSGGPLVVNATGNSRTTGVGLVGLQIGHEFSDGSSGEGCWTMAPAAEVEGYYFGGTQRALLDNPTPRLPEHVFDDSFPTNNAVLMLNGVVNLHTPSRILTPYIGGGIGLACICISGANSPQVAPPEMGINHFNSNPDSSAWAFAAQGKLGVRLQLSDRAFVFTEYRFLYVGSTTDVFGPTVYPTHAPTTPWTVKFGDMCSHMGVAGVGFSF